ncbi:MAG: hypothetical protein L0Y75_09245 [Acidobacteria bacterium]|nr:hypothetical protein [Acidobacteriota bacterium]
MQNAQEIYFTIRTLPSAELLRLAALILDDLAQAAGEKPEIRPTPDLSKGRKPSRLSKAERDAKDLEIINRNADRLNEEAMDVLNYQIEL